MQKVQLKVTWGETIVYAGVKFEMRTPWPDRPAGRFVDVWG